MHDLIEREWLAFQRAAIEEGTREAFLKLARVAFYAGAISAASAIASAAEEGGSGRLRECLAAIEAEGAQFVAGLRPAAARAN